MSIWPVHLLGVAISRVDEQTAREIFAAEHQNCKNTSLGSLSSTGLHGITAGIDPNRWRSTSNLNQPYLARSR